MNHPIEISAQAFYLAEHSDPANERYAFAYRITIRNRSTLPVRLLNRHWLINDATGKTEEVRGEGVVGEQPHLQPGEDFQYTSWAVLPTAVGSMEGSYGMLADDGERFDAAIPAFTLAVPKALH